MTDPIQIMDEIERSRAFEENGVPRSLDACDDWQSLRTALEAQAEELAQKEARIARLEQGQVLAVQSLRDRWSEGGTCLLVAEALQGIVNESPAQSGTALKAEALREASNLVMQPVEHGGEGWAGKQQVEMTMVVQEHLAGRLDNEAGRIEREAKEES